jgi:hypothetical protein
VKISQTAIENKIRLDVRKKGGVVTLADMIFQTSACMALGVSADTIERWHKRGRKLPRVKIFGRWQWDVSGLAKMIILK